MTGSSDHPYIPKLGIIIVTYNGSIWINRCLDSILHEDILSTIYIVDNGSTDNTVELIKKGYPDVRLTIAPKNLGFGQGNNLAISQALDDGIELFFLLNQDAWILPGSSSQLCQTMLHHPDYGIISPIHLNGKGSDFDEHFYAFLLQAEIKNTLLNTLTKGEQKQQLIDTPVVNAAAWMVSRKCLEIVGGFDPIFFHYGEDDNYLQRTKYKQLKIGILTGTFIIHDKDRPSQPNATIPIHKRIYASHIQTLVYACDLHRPNFREILLKNCGRHLFAGAIAVVKFNPADIRYHFSLAKKSVFGISDVKKSRRKNKSTEQYLYLR
jgi:GT2 family glycosyltransferase